MKGSLAKAGPGELAEDELKGVRKAETGWQDEKVPTGGFKKVELLQ